MPPRKRKPPIRSRADTQSDNESPQYKRRLANVFDATAGRVGQRTLALPGRSPTPNLPGQTNPNNPKPIKPDEVLFRQKNAPPRYAETDYYFSSQALGPDKPLPSSDLLRAVHAYFAEFVDRGGLRGRAEVRRCVRGLDETALIALGVLLEETCGSVLGETGDGVFTEGVEEEGDEEDREEERSGEREWEDEEDGDHESSEEGDDPEDEEDEEDGDET